MVKNRFGVYSYSFRKRYDNYWRKTKNYCSRGWISLPENKILEEKAKLNSECPYKLFDIQNWEGYKEHAFFKASSIRKIGDTYYFIYFINKWFMLYYK